MEGTETDKAQRYVVPWEFRPRLLSEHLGRQNYTTPTRAIGELVANSFDAGATTVEVWIGENDLGGIDSITVSDNGSGISPADLRTRFAVAGIEPAHEPSRFARFGVGRFAVFRIGSLSEWTSFSQDSGTTRQLHFTLRPTQTELEIEELELPGESPTGTTVKISNILDAGSQSPTAARIKGDLLAQYCSYLLSHPNHQIRIQGETIEVERSIESRQTEKIEPTDDFAHPATIDHLLLNAAVEKSRFPAQVMFTSKGRMIASHQPEDPPSPRYLALVDSPYLEEIVATSREALVDMDGGFAALKQIALDRVNDFGEKFRFEHRRRFIERARQQTYYPYRDEPKDEVSRAEQALYDVVLEKVNEHANLESMNQKQQALVFTLTKRSLHDENLLEVLTEIAKLSSERIARIAAIYPR